MNDKKGRFRRRARRVDERRSDECSARDASSDPRATESFTALRTTILACVVTSCALAGLAGCSSRPSPTVFTTSDSSAGDDASAPGTDGGFVGDDGGVFNLDGSSGFPDSAGAVGQLTAIIRDFRMYDAGDPTTDPDFENPPYDIGNDGGPSPGYKGSWYDTEIVADALGADQTPTYRHPGQKTVTTHGADAFQKWFHDVPGTNVRVAVPLNLTADAKGVYGYDSEISGVPYDSNPADGKGFFPIDDGSPYATSFGNQTYAHNFSFTVEIHTTFTYRGGEFFQFRGDDDVFVFINNAIVINLGGIHDAQPAQVSLDSLGLTIGKSYPLDFFSAERHVYGSNIEISTSLALIPTIPK